MEKHIQIAALDILVEVIINHQELDSSFPTLEKIALKYNEVYKDDEFSTVITEKIKYYKDHHITNDDSLFIENSYTPYIVKKNELYTVEDKIKVFSLILEWSAQFKVGSNYIISKLATGLDIEHELSKKIELFISAPLQLKDERTFLCINPPDENHIDKLEGDWVDTNKPEYLKNEEQLTLPRLKDAIFALYLSTEKLFLLKRADSDISQLHFSQNHTDSICLIDIDSSVCINGDSNVNFTELKNLLNQKLNNKNFALVVENVSKSYKNGKILGSLDFIALPGELYGVIGAEGSGKSTLLNVLAGMMTPTSGAVYLNAYNTEQYKYQLSGLIGFVPEDDLLYSELTAFENIEYALRLSNSSATKTERERVILKLFNELKITNIINKKVGESEQKRIQPYQRRLLNIARELVRDPNILIINNSKPGLSLGDASKVIDILSQYTYTGKLIITSIAETNKRVFNSFDKLIVLDKNGKCIYNDLKSNAFKHLTTLLPKGLLHKYAKLDSFTTDVIIEAVDDIANTKPEIISYNTNINKSELTESFSHYKKKKTLPVNNSLPPRLEQQFLSYTLRNFKTKISKKKEISYVILSAPILATVLAIFLRYSPGNEYSFSANENIPLYFYLSIIISIFLGLTQSANEIIFERKVLEREEYTNLSFFSYINAKSSFLIIILFLQSLLYTLIGNSILEIHEMTLYHWAIYFSSGTAGVLLGLVFSSIHQTYSAILIKTIPATMLALILFGGGLIPVERYKSNNNKYTPVLSDLMINRWAYEAIMVKQYVSNPYEKIFFNSHKSISIGTYNSHHVLPLLNNLADYALENNLQDSDTLEKVLALINNQISFYNQTEDVFPFEFQDSLNISRINGTIIEELKDYLTYIDYYFQKKQLQGVDNKLFVLDSLKNHKSSINHIDLETLNHNKAINRIVNSSGTKPFEIINNELVQLSEVIYQPAYNNFGRAHFFSSEKQFNDQKLNTFEFNLSIIWIMNLFVYILLIANIPYRVVSQLNKYILRDFS